MKARVSLACAAVALICAGSAEATPRTGANVDVIAGLGPEALPGAPPQSYASGFFPTSVTVHVGDTVTWHIRTTRYVGITFRGRFPPQHFSFFTSLGQPKEGVVKDAAGYPFWFSGSVGRQVVPRVTFEPQGGATISSPTQVRSSGMRESITGSREPYRLRFLRPGVYPYFDPAGGPRGAGSVIVVPAGAVAPTPAAQEQQAAAEVKRVVADLRVLARARPADPLTVWAGSGRNGHEVAAFLPGRLTIRAGQVVTFAPRGGGHAVMIGPPAYTAQIARTFVSDQGAVNLLGFYPSQPFDTRQPITYTGSNHGNGFLSGGVLDLPGLYPTFRVRFTTPGTYHYRDSFTPQMEGVIVVE